MRGRGSKFSVMQYMLWAAGEGTGIPTWAVECDGKTEDEMLTEGWTDPRPAWMVPAEGWHSVDLMATDEGGDETVVFSAIQYAIATENLELSEWAHKCDGMTARQMWEKENCFTMRRWMIPRRE